MEKEKEQAGQLAEFLSRLPFQQYVSLTYPRFTSRERAQGTLTNWLNQLERHHRAVIGGVATTECQYRGRHVHHHLLLVSCQLLDSRFERNTWKSLAKTRSEHSILIDPYDPRQGALRYVLKMYASDWDQIELLKLEYFADLPSTYWTASARRRRQYRRQIARVQVLD